MNRMMYAPIWWVMVEMNAPTWVRIIFWCAFVVDIVVAILEKAIYKKTGERV